MVVFILLSTKHYETDYIGVYSTYEAAYNRAIDLHLVDEDGFRQFEIHKDYIDGKK